MTTTLVLPGSIADDIHRLARDVVETGGVLLARPVPTDGGLRLLAREFWEVPAAAYDRRDAQGLVIRSEGYVPALARAEEQGCVAIWFHTHPGKGSSPQPSRHDIEVNRQLTDLFRIRADSDYYGWLITATEGAGLRFTGGLDGGGEARDIDRLWVVGSRLDLFSNDSTESGALPDLYDRNVRAFGGAIQHVLADISVAVIGCGGTGSAVSEQLVRLGVRKLTLVDPDDLSASNVTRVYGSRLKDVGRPKADVLADHLEDVLPGTEIRRIKSMTTVEATARALLSADVVFGCTDDNAGRMVLSRLATFLMVPVIDCGVLLSADADSKLDGIHGRVTVLHPGQACLICRGRIDLARAGSELLTPDERVRLVGEGYAPALPGIEPAVVAFTTAVAAMAVGELLERLAHYGVDPVPSEVLLRLHDRELSTNNQVPADRHYCDPAAGKLGLGMTEPFLEQTWQA